MRSVRKPLTKANSLQSAAAIAPTAPSSNSTDVDNMTVEQYLEAHLESLVKDFKQHTESLVAKLQEEYKEGAKSINDLMNQNRNDEKRICVNLKCVAGPHIGQRFRLEPSTEDGEDTFKMGRSTGKLFKEKGVSLYKDKEISTTHAKIELRNGQAFLVDAGSTNGTQLNGADVEAQLPLRLQDGDKICMGSTELVVHVAVVEVDQEN